ncbi:phage tail tube protein [Roseinatronobacter sp.]
MARAHGGRAQMALAFETIYGTPPASGYTRMPFASSTLGADQPLLQSELLGYGRDPLAPIKDALNADGDVVIPIDARAFGFWLKAAFGDPTSSEGEDGSGDPNGVFTHVFHSGSWTLPSMAIEVGMPEVPSFALYPGCRVDGLSLTMQRAGLLTATARLIPQGEVLDTAAQTGTLDEIALRRFGHFNGMIQRDGVALANVVSAELSYQNNLDRIETIRADGLIDGADPGMAMLTGRMDVRFSDTALLMQAIDGTPCALEFGWALPSGESLTIAAHAVYLPRPRREINGPQGVQASFEWQAARDPDTGRMCTTTLINDRSEY